MSPICLDNGETADAIRKALHVDASDFTVEIDVCDDCVYVAVFSPLEFKVLDTDSRGNITIAEQRGSSSDMISTTVSSDGEVSGYSTRFGTFSWVQTITEIDWPEAQKRVIKQTIWKQVRELHPLVMPFVNQASYENEHGDRVEPTPSCQFDG